MNRTKLLSFDSLHFSFITIIILMTRALIYNTLRTNYGDWFESSYSIIALRLVLNLHQFFTDWPCEGNLYLVPSYFHDSILMQASDDTIWLYNLTYQTKYGYSRHSYKYETLTRIWFSILLVLHHKITLHSPRCS